MLTACCASRRIALRPAWVLELSGHRRHIAHKPGPGNQIPRNNNGSSRSRTKGNGEDFNSTSKHSGDETPSLIEQLFPEESKRYEAAQQAAREIPRLPIETPSPIQRPKPARKVEETSKSWAARQLRAEIEAAEPGTAILVLRHASPNLTEEDFRRLIPQGRHIEGWTLEQGDFYKVVPARDLSDLAPQNAYYLLFSSALSAFTYQGHVMRIHSLAAQHTPSSVTSPVPPSPGYMVQGLDVHAAIEAYALISPSQKLELRLLKRPLSPLMQSLARHQGLPGVVNRKGKMPFEVRLTLDGHQTAPSVIRHLMMKSGQARGLSWSGGENMGLAIERWNPKGETGHVSPMDRSRHAEVAADMDFTKQRNVNGTRSTGSTIEDGDGEQKRRTPPVVYIVGFRTERAAQSFVSHWHRKPLPVEEEDVHGDFEGDLPPIMNAQLLW